jgi:hypothetical protein
MENQIIKIMKKYQSEEYDGRFTQPKYNIIYDHDFKKIAKEIAKEIKPKTKWIATKDKLPEEGKYVLARRNTRSKCPYNSNCVVVKIVKGISKKDRQLMKDGKIPTTTVTQEWLTGGCRETTVITKKRYDIYNNEDEHGNNRVPYNWETVGNSKFYGQEITHWMPIEPLI